MKNKSIVKILSVFLVFVLVSQSLPLSAIAEGGGNNSEPETVIVSGEEVEIVQEIPELETNYETVSLLEDGTFAVNSELEIDDEDNDIEEGNDFVEISKGCITVFQDAADYNEENAEFYMDDCMNGAIVNFDTTGLENKFIKDAYVIIETVDSEDSKVCVAPITDEILSYDEIDYSLPLDYITIEDTDVIKLDVTSELNKYILGKDNYGLFVYSPNGLMFTDINLNVIYSSVLEVDPNIENEVINMDRAGKVYINDFNCTPTVIRNDIGLEGALAPVQIQNIYNPISGYSGFRPNYESKIQYIDGEKPYFVWNNDKGEELYFTSVGQTTTKKTYNAIDANKNTLTLEWTSSSGNFTTVDYEQIVITDADDNLYYFYDFGYLSEIYVNGNSNCNIVIEYDSYIQNNSTVYYVKKVIDGANRTYLFSYENNQLISISANRLRNGTLVPLTINSEDICVEYSYSNNKITVTYSDDEYVEYFFDTYSRINKIVSNNGNYLEIQYLGDSCRVSNYKLKQPNNINNSTTLLADISINFSEPYRRTFSNALEYERNFPKTKILDFNRNFELIYLENYDNSNYFMTRDNDNNYHLTNILNSYASNNLIKNSDFTDGYTTNWSKMYSSNGSLNDENDSGRRLRADNSCLQITGNENKNIGVYQQIANINGDYGNGKQFIIEGYAKAPHACENIINTNKKFSIIVAKNITQNVNRIPPAEKIVGRIDFQSGFSNWQFQRVAFTLSGQVNNVYVYLCYGNMVGNCYYDAVKLYEYNQSELTSSNDNNRYVYDDWGRLKKERIEGVSLVKEKEYEYSGNKLISTINNGVTEYYNYDNYTNLLNSCGYTQNASGNTAFLYDGMGALTSVEKTISQLDNETASNLSDININTSYTNLHDRVIGVTHNGFTYQIDYDGYGNISDVQINNSSIYRYNGNITTGNRNNSISSVKYGDGTTLFYFKSIDDNYCNTITICETNLPNPVINNLESSYYYVYDYDGTLLEYVDYKNNTTSVWRNGEYSVINTAVEINDENDNYLKQELDKYILYKTNNSIENIILALIHDHPDNITLSDLKILYSTNNNNSIKLFGQSFLLNTTHSVDSVSQEQTTSVEYSLVNELNQNSNESISTISTVVDDLDREKSATITYDIEENRLDVESIYSYKNLSGNKTTDLIAEYSEDLTAYEYSIPEGANTPTATIQGEATISYSYNYNSIGKISEVYKKTDFQDSNNPVAYELVKHYEYDELGQIIEEVDLEINRCTLYYYDIGGNIVEKRIYQNVTSGNNPNTAFSFNSSTYDVNLISCSKDICYSYGDSTDWNDLLTTFDGHQISYDSSGNPTTYYGTDIMGRDVSGTMVWSGKNLVSFSNSNNRYEYKYNADGLRTKKTIYSITTLQNEPVEEKTCEIEYIWDNDVITGYKYTIYSNNVATYEYIVKPLYDNENNIKSIPIIKREIATGDIVESDTVAILKDGLGNICMSSILGSNTTFTYNYDAYGNTYVKCPSFGFDSTQTFFGDSLIILLIAIALSVYANSLVMCTQQNYRGYLYDFETGLYYNQTRYYSPAWGRFINPDEFASLLTDKINPIGSNLFAYCNNDPINNVDPSGFATKSIASDEGLLNLAGINGTYAIDVDASKVSNYYGTSSKLIESSLNIDSVSKEIWDNKLRKNTFTLYKGNGYNYFLSNFESIGNDKVEFYSYKERTPYSF